ncbi:MAG TPA: 3-hydroxyacyl-CoA dehydrogenase NAD-binding domain-containing protein, partial [Gaiellaceae bacterium]|nr:3-hydroxyacyl-CoA dehydrogenase NAD-binding domain-containing protein [Gaiellaceae bacterium]
MEIRTVGVVGLGTMGAGIAQVCVEAGYETVGRELAAEAAEAARGRIDHFLTRKVEKGQVEKADKDAAVARLSVTTELGDLAGCDLVVEAAFEDLTVKHELMGELSRVLRSDAIVATNTSALSVTEIAAAYERPERVVGLHFFNPAPLMKLVEVVRTILTDDATVQTAYGWVQSLGKTPVQTKDSTAFIVNRLLV